MRRGHRSGVLGWELAGDAHDGIVLVPSDDTGFRVRFLGSRARKAGQNRMHYDLTSTSPEDQQERRWRRRSGRAPGTSTSANAPEEGHVVLADPDGRPGGGGGTTRHGGYSRAMRYLELLRHTDNDGDELTPEGVAAAETLGQERLAPPYDLFGSTGATRATEMVEILRRIVGQEDVPVTEVRGLRSSVEDRWRAAARTAGPGADVEAMRSADPDLVEREALLLGSALRGVFDALPEGGRALVVGHSPTNEAAVLGLAGEVIGPLGKGEGVLLVEDRGRFHVRPWGRGPG